MSKQKRARNKSWLSASSNLLIVCCLLLTTYCLLPTAYSPSHAQVRAHTDEGAVALGMALRRLQTTASVLHTGAHPDDEDSALIARLARGDGARTAYLSLNRGEGGQNRIGPELFDALGVIRTEELLQARRLDGGEQFFTRTFDFGFTKTRAETAARWNEKEVLADMVRVIRQYRPFVIISRFTGTPEDGHGHHQYAGYLTPIAYRAAADPTQFPEQLAAGLRPWQARKLYVSVFGQDTQPANDSSVVEINTGQYDPLLGRSYYELAMEGRSQHKSQGEGALELRGPQKSRVRLLVTAPEFKITGRPEASIFDGLDTSIKGIAQTVGWTDSYAVDELTGIERAAVLALERYRPFDTQPVVEPLVDGLNRTHALYMRVVERLHQEQLNPALARARADAVFMLAQKEREFKAALRLASGVRVDALADTETVAPGDTFNVTVRAFLPDTKLARYRGFQLRAPAGWRVEQQEALSAGPPDAPTATFRVTVPADAPPTQPYWLQRPRKGDMYEWTKDDPQTLPFAPPLVFAGATIEVGGLELGIPQPVEYRTLDGVRGEVRRELNVVPALTVELQPQLLIVPTQASDRTKTLTVQLTNNVPRVNEQPDAPVLVGKADVHVPPGWSLAQQPPSFALYSAGARVSQRINFAIPLAAKPGTYQLDALAEAKYQHARSGQVLTFSNSLRTISYPHIQTHRLYAPASATVRVFDLQVAPVRVGYIMGSGDEVPQALERMGLKVTMLSEQDLAAGDLTRFDTIVVGIRASQARPDFVANSQRLLEFMQQGGALIVQYQRPDYAKQNLPPFPAQQEVPTKNGGTSIARVVDETAPVTLLQPAHAAFNFPNKITAEDWRGWVQERNLYNFTTFDPRYVPLLEAHDADEAANNGGEVYARVGRGHYVYTSYAWFRQLPAGVPGAYRLFANLLSLPKAPAPQNR
ncbi:MAG: PIG-L family deacetylase [Pyrinomonadaceae bacterium]